MNRYSPMLASQGLTRGSTADELVATLDARGDYIFDLKMDGIRCLAYVEAGVVTLLNRRGINITRRYPDVVGHLAAAYPTGTRVFDGEIVVWDGTRFDFTLALKRDAQQNESRIKMAARMIPATYVAFDLLQMDEDDLREVPLLARLRLLKVEGEQSFGQGLLVSQYGEDGQAMWEAVQMFGFEGLIAKHRTSRYVGRRQSSWIKIKRLHRVTCIVTGFDPGEGGRRNQVGALHLSLLDDDDQLVPVGRVGTGFKTSDHGPLLEVLRRGEEFLVEVEFMELQKSSLRQPSYKGVRFDVSRRDCRLSQLTT